MSRITGEATKEPSAEAMECAREISAELCKRHYAMDDTVAAAIIDAALLRGNEKTLDLVVKELEAKHGADAFPYIDTINSMRKA